MKTVIEMAREAGIHAEYTPGMIPLLERFAELVRADEREACAKVVDENAKQCNRVDIRLILKSNAAAIRARSNT